MTFLARILCVSLCVAFPCLIRATLVHAVKGVGCITVNGAGTCSDGPPSVKTPIHVSPGPECRSQLCEITLTITFDWDSHQRAALTGKPALTQVFVMDNSWSDMAFYQQASMDGSQDYSGDSSGRSHGPAVGCLLVGSKDGIALHSDRLFCSNSYLYEGDPISNPYHALVGYHWDVFKGEYVPDDKSQGDSSSSNLVPTTDTPAQSVVGPDPEISLASQDGTQAVGGNGNVQPPEEIAVEDNYGPEGYDNGEDLNVFQRRHPVKWSG